MTAPQADLRIAGTREAGSRCPHCQADVMYGDRIAVCGHCGAAHHEWCWNGHDGKCGTYQCQPDRRVLGRDSQPVLTITDEEVARAVPQPLRRPMAVSMPVEPPRQPAGHGLAWTSLMVALAGIVLFGLVTGLLAVVLAAVALSKIHHTRGRGTAVALLAMLLGIVVSVGWALALILLFSPGSVSLTLNEFEPDPAALENLPPHINRAMKANVLIVTRAGWRGLAGTGIGSGVILRITDGRALIVTNRHVVDPQFADEPIGDAIGPVPEGLAADGQVQVKLIGQEVESGQVVWVAPDGIDLALITVPVAAGSAQAAAWERHRPLVMGNDVFSIGNPQNLGWTHTRGSISQLRLQTRGNRKIQVVQTDAAINPGNSGGGLYDRDGFLLGINTWTNDKRFSEGISFAISMDALLDLDPPPLRTAEQQGD